MTAAKKAINYLYRIRNYAIEYLSNSLHIQIFEASSNVAFTNNINN